LSLPAVGEGEPEWDGRERTECARSEWGQADTEDGCDPFAHDFTRVALAHGMCVGSDFGFFADNGAIYMADLKASNCDAFNSVFEEDV